jgi:hypothetical protein
MTSRERVVSSILGLWTSALSRCPGDERSECREAGSIASRSFQRCVLGAGRELQGAANGLPGCGSRRRRVIAAGLASRSNISLLQ